VHEASGGCSLLAANQDENFDGGRAFFSASGQGICAYALLRL
jgi:hypothetical protein